MNRLVEAALPARMGTSFRWLVGSSWLTNLGDGIALAVGPLLVASQTRNPFLVSLAVVLQRAPWLLFGLHAGVIADRFNRRRILISAHLARSAILVALIVAVAIDRASIVVVLLALFGMGISEVFADVTSGTLLPMLVPHSDLGVGNARLTFGTVSLNLLIGPPIGAALFAAGVILPFTTELALVLLGVMLTTRLVLPSLASPGESLSGNAESSMASEISEGIRWLWHHPPMRTLALTILSFNLAFGAAWSILVLLALERLGIGGMGFALLTSTSAAGGIVGTIVYGRLEHRFGVCKLMRAGLIIETLTYLSLAVVRTAWVAMLVLFFFGLHESVWGTTSRTVRQRAVPMELQGRIGAVYTLGLQGGLVVGALIGGLVGRTWGVTGPFWFAFVLSVAILVTIWRSLESIADGG